MRILVSYRGIPPSPGWATGDFVLAAFRRLGHEVYPYGNYYMTGRTIEDLNPNDLLGQSYDLYLQMECGDGDRFYSELVHLKAKKVASWWFDISLYPERWIHHTVNVNSTINFVANKKYKDFDLTSRYLPYAADVEKHLRLFNNCHQRQFALIGSDRPERRALIGRLKTAGIDAHLISDVYRESYVDALASTEFVINDIAGGGEGLIAMRPFEVLASGSSLITPKDDGCKELGLPCIEYTDLDHLVELCNNDNYEKIWNNDIIRHRNQKYVLDNHMYENRCEEILKICFKKEQK